MKVRLGYVTDNIGLSEKDIKTSRTTRLNTINNNGIPYAIELAWKNLNDLLTILEWNEKNGIRFYRMSSYMFPHLTNPALLPKHMRSNPHKLAYSLSIFSPLLIKIGKYVRIHKHRLTFHPDPYISLGTSDNDLLIRGIRELYAHSLIMDLMGLDMNSTITIHGGGVLNDKNKTIQRWIVNFNNLSLRIKRRIALENDEFRYSITDVLKISKLVNPYKVKGYRCSTMYKIPIIFDIFHYKIYNRNDNDIQPEISTLLPMIARSWGTRTPKMHISEQYIDKHPGAHADYVRHIPDILLTFPIVFKKPLDLMIEAKKKELALAYLRKKYKKSCK